MPSKGDELPTERQVKQVLERFGKVSNSNFRRLMVEVEASAGSGTSGIKDEIVQALRAIHLELNPEDIYHTMQHGRLILSVPVNPT